MLKQEFWEPYAPNKYPCVISQTRGWTDFKAKEHTLNQEQAAAAGGIETCQSETQGFFSK